MTESTHHGLVGMPRIRRVHSDRPWAWLTAGWRDMMRAPMLSLPFGVVYAAGGAVMTVLIWVYGHFYLILPLVAGFLLIGPIAAVGLYQISRRLSRGQPLRVVDVLTAWRANPVQIALMGVVLILFMFAWFRLATLLFFLFVSGAPPAPDALAVLNLALMPESLPALVIGTLIGAVLAAVVFAISVVSIPLLMDRPDSNVISAIIASFLAVRENFWTMALWAWLVALFIGAGLASGYILLIFTLPLIGHATWHAYEDLIGWGDD